MEEEFEEQSERAEQKESVKLIKTSRGYNWQLRLLPLGACLDDKDLERLSKLNLKLANEYGTDPRQI